MLKFSGFILIPRSSSCLRFKPNITVTLDGQTKVKIEGADKQKVGQVASEIRAFSPAEPYKGKGVKYKGERVRRKEGKTVQ